MRYLADIYSTLPNNTPVLWKNSTIHKFDDKGKPRCGISTFKGKEIQLVQAIVYLGPDDQWCFNCWQLH